SRQLDLAAALVLEWPSMLLRVAAALAVGFTLLAMPLIDAPGVRRLVPSHSLLAQARASASTPSSGVPRTPEGRPNLQGIWQVRNSAAVDLEDHPARYGGRPGRSVVEGGSIPYQPWALAKKRENAAAGAEADPLAKGYMPGVPRIMDMDFPYQIFQTRTHVGITFEWSQVFRLIYTDGSPHHQGIEFWMGDSRGRWEGD